jgi:hypothetical protein
MGAQVPVASQTVSAPWGAISVLTAASINRTLAHRFIFLITKRIPYYYFK